MSGYAAERAYERLKAAEERGSWLYEPDRNVAGVLRRRAKEGVVIEIAPSIFGLKCTWDGMRALPRYLYLLRAVSCALPGCVFCRESAAVLHGLSVSYANLRHVHVATSKAAHSDSSRLVERHIVEGDIPVTVGGLRATSLVRTAFDCMRAEDFPRALAIADSTLRSGRVSTDELGAYILSMRHFPGIQNARRAYSYADPRAENGGESIARATMIELDYLLPDLQYPVLDQLTGKTYRVDFLWRLAGGTTVAGELDGRQKYEDPIYMGGRDIVQVLTDERKRESRLSIGVDRICRFSLQNVFDRPFFARLLETYGVPHVR